jgi:hypothetical protein
MSFLSAAIFLALSGCGGSGGGGAGGSGGAATLPLVVDSAAGGASLVARVEALAFERADGSFTANLLLQPAAAALADAGGAPVFLALTAPPADVYVAVQILLHPDAQSVAADGVRTAVVLPRLDHRVALESPTRLGAGLGWLELRHRSGLDLRARGDGRLDWHPDFACRRGDDRELLGSSFVVVRLSPADFTIHASPDRSVRTAVALRVPDTAVLTRASSGTRLDRAALFAALAPGTEIRVWGRLTAALEITVTALEVDDSSRSGDETKVLGRVERLDGALRTLDVQVLRIDRGGAGLDGTRLPLLVVDASGARIHRSGARHIPLDFAALAVGQIVEVEWRGSPSGGRVQAHEIEIEDEAGGAQREIEGQVGEVRIADRVIVAVPRGNDPLIVGGRSVSSARVRLGPDAYLFRADDDPVPIALSQVAAGERIWVKSYTLDGADVVARVVRIRSR